MDPEEALKRGVERHKEMLRLEIGIYRLAHPDLTQGEINAALKVIQAYPCQSFQTVMEKLHNVA